MGCSQGQTRFFHGTRRGAHGIFGNRDNGRQRHDGQNDTAGKGCFSNRKVQPFLYERNDYNQSEETVYDRRNPCQQFNNRLQYLPGPFICSELVSKEPGIIAFFPQQYLAKNFRGTVLPEEKISLSDFFAGTKWYPTSAPAPIFGLIPLLLGTLLVSIGAIVLSLPFGIAVAIYLAEIANKRTREILKPVMITL